MKTTILLLLMTAGLSAQSLAVTSPANGSVVTWGFSLTAAPTSLPSLTLVRFYIDGRLECVVNNTYFGAWSCPLMKYATYSDERAATIYAEGYNALGAKIATSGVNTFRINNTGVNAVMTINCGSGTIANGGTVSGSCAASTGSNATVAGTQTLFNIDGIAAYTVPIEHALNTNISTSNGKFTVPVIYGHNGSPVYLHCIVAANTAVNTQIPTFCNNGDSDMPNGFLNYIIYYEEICGPNCIQLATTPGGPPVVPTTQGVSAEYTQISPVYQEWLSTGPGGSSPYTFDSTYFSNGLHRIEHVLRLGGDQFNQPGTFAFPSTSINAGTGVVTSTNVPLVQGQAVTCSGTCPSQWTGTMYTIVQDANDFCLASSAANAAAGACIVSLSGANGTLTINFFVPSTFVDSQDGAGYQQILGTDIQEMNFSNGSAPSVLRTKYSRIVGIAGDTFTLAPYYLNCDGSTTALSANHPVYSTNDAARATVSSSGVVTLGSTVGHAIISVADALSTTNGRDTQIDVEVRPDRTTYKHMSAGYGILSNYDPAKSKVGIVCFNCVTQTLTSNPFPRKYLIPAFTAVRGLVSTDTVNVTGAYGNAGSLSSWQSTWWNGSSIFGKASVQSIAAQIAPMLSYGGTPDLCHGYQAYRFYTDSWRQQALKQMMNDMAYAHLGWEHCDEMTGKFGFMPAPRGDMGSGTDGLGHSTLGGQTAGLTSIVVPAGCSSTPCQMTATVNIRTWPFFAEYDGSASGYRIQIAGATTANLNGPAVATNLTYAFDNALGEYMTSFQITTFDVLSGTYNSTTDSGLAITSNAQGNDYNTPFASATGHIAGNGQQGYAFGDSGGPTNVTCASNVCTFPWTGHPFSFSGQTAKVGGFAATGLNGYWRTTVFNANSISVRVASVANGTYFDAGAYIDAMANFAQSYVSNMFSNSTGYFTGTRPPLAGSIVGGYNTGKFSWAAWQGGALTDYIAQNSNPQAYDRYGGLISMYRNQYRVETQPLVDGSLLINSQVDTTKPRLYESQFNGQTCAKFLQTSDCRTDQIAGDLIDFEPTWNGTVFMSNLFPWCCLPNGAGSLPYQYAAQSGFGRVPPGPFAFPGIGYYQTPPNEVDQFPDQWLGMVSVSLWAQHEDKYLLAPLLSSPDENVGPGPFAQVECTSHTASYGNALICANLTEERQTVTFDLSIVNPGGAGGPMRRWNLSAFGDTVTELSPSTTSDTQTLLSAQAVMYISQAAGSVDDLKAINMPITLAYGATKAAVEVHYYLNDKVFQAVDCGIGVCPSIPVNLHNLDVYFRKRFTKSDGTPVMVGDMERLPAQ